MTALTRGETLAALEVGAARAADCELADPSGWADLLAHPELAAGVVERRLVERRTPKRGQVFRWPKDRKGWRPMSWLDPYDPVTSFPTPSDSTTGV